MEEQIPEIPSPTQPIQPVTQVPVEPKKKSNLPRIVISLVVISLIAGGVYAGMQLEKRKVKVWTEPPFTEITPEPTEVVDETANWKTYTNTNPYLFQIKYPADWTKKMQVASGWPYFESPEGEIISFNAGPKGGISGNDTIANYCQTRDKAGTILERHDIIIENNPSVYCVDKNRSIAEFMIPVNNTQYEITCTLGKLDICLQILSTFKFTN